MDLDDQNLLRFLEPQLRDYGGHHAIDTGLWTLFALSAADAPANALARSLLAGAPFAHDSGPSTDDQWMLYYVDDANRAAAVHWLDDLAKSARGEIRPAAPAHRALAAELVDSPKPHRIAQQLAELHARGEICAGLVAEPGLVRGCLDRLHQREPLAYSAFLTLLNHHLVDMVVLHRQIIGEDVGLLNEIVKGGLSHDPFLQTRQDSAAEIRNALIRFQVINPLDQQKHTAIANPYAVYLEIKRDGDQLILPLDGKNLTVTRASFVQAIHSIRRNLYRGEQFESFDTQAPWMSEAIAYPFRFIKQRLGVHRDLVPLDALYMLERAVDA